MLFKKESRSLWGFCLKNVKFIDTKMTQSTEEFSRRIMATYVAESKIPFRIPFSLIILNLIIILLILFVM